MRAIDADALKKFIHDQINWATNMGISADGEFMYELIEYAIDNAETIATC